MNLANPITPPGDRTAASVNPELRGEMLEVLGANTQPLTVRGLAEQLHGEEPDMAMVLEARGVLEALMTEGLVVTAAVTDKFSAKLQGYILKEYANG